MPVGTVTSCQDVPGPHIPLIGVGLLIIVPQEALDPPLLPRQDQNQGPVQVTTVGVPTKQSDIHHGIDDWILLFAIPHNPLIGKEIASHCPVDTSRWYVFSTHAWRLLLRIALSLQV